MRTIISFQGWPTLLNTTLVTWPLVIASPAWGQMALGQRIEILKEVVDALGAAGDALSKLGDGIAHIVALGASGYDDVIDRMQQSRMEDLQAHLAGMRSFNISILDSLDGYLKFTGGHPFTAEHPNIAETVGLTWDSVRNQLTTTLDNVDKLLSDVKALRGDIVNEPAYTRLIVTLGQRRELLTKLKGLPEPTTEEELDLLREAASKYQTYIGDLEWVQRAVCEYNRRIHPNKFAQEHSEFRGGCRG